MVLFLCPGPSFWYSLLQDASCSEGCMVSFLSEKFQLFLIIVEEHKEIKQLSVHFVLMGVLVYLGLQEYKDPGRINNELVRFGCMLGFVFILSLCIETVQSWLPVSFARSFDWMDIVFSLSGGLIGGIIALGVQQK